jgi:ribosomal protein L11 methyltransferase
VSWIEFKLIIQPEILEQVSGYLFAMGCEGIHVREKDISIYFSQHNWSDEIKSALVSYLSLFDASFSQRSFKVVSLAGQNWNQTWQEAFRPLRIGSTIYISPPWEIHKASAGEISVIINPQMAFGTGHHESTQLIIERMAAHLRTGMQVLDVGTGSGILAVIARKMQAAQVLGIDNDLVAIKNALENKMLNRIDGHLQFVLAELHQLQPAENDMILANINLPVILDLAHLFPKYLKPNGWLIVSGVLLNDEPELIKKMAASGFIVIEKANKKEWLVLVFKLKAAHAGSN